MKIKLKPKKEIIDIINAEIDMFKERGLFVEEHRFLSEDAFRNSQMSLIKDFKDNEIMEVEKIVCTDGIEYYYLFPWFVEDGKQYYGNIYPEWVESEVA